MDQLNTSSPENQPNHLFNSNNIKLILLLILVSILSSLGTYLVLKSKSNVQTSIQPTPLPTQALVTQPVLSPTSPPDETANWKTFGHDIGRYSIMLPPNWTFKEEKEFKASSFENLPFSEYISYVKNRVYGEIKIITANYLRGEKFAGLSEGDFYDLNNTFWLRGNQGGGPGRTYENPVIILINKQKWVKQTTHPTNKYEWSYPEQLTDNYYLYSNTFKEIVWITFNYDDRNIEKARLLKTFNQILSTFLYIPIIIQ